MLIFKRKFYESIIINHNIRITLLGKQGRYMRVGIEAPLDIPVNREEIEQKILKEDSE